MNKKIKEVIMVSSALIVILSFLISGGPEKTIEWFSKTFDSDDPNQFQIVETPFPLGERLEIMEDSLINKKQIYEPGEVANISFDIENTLNNPYNISVDWFVHGERKKGWSSISTNNSCNSSFIHCHFYSWYPVNDFGEWKVQIIVDTFLDGKYYSDEKILEFEVY